MWKRSALATVLVLAACGDDGGGAGDSGSIDAVVDVDAVVAEIVPDPGTEPIPFSWPDTEPNDTPSQASPVGTSISKGEWTWFDGTVESGSVGGADTRDYYVFKSSPQGGTFHNTPCWDSAEAPDLMDFYVYQVDDGMVGAIVGSSMDTDSGCENIGSAADFTMEPSTVYLLEHRAKGAASATYSA